MNLHFKIFLRANLMPFLFYLFPEYQVIGQFILSLAHKSSCGNPADISRTFRRLALSKTLRTTHESPANASASWTLQRRGGAKHLTRIPKSASGSSDAPSQKCVGNTFVARWFGGFPEGVKKCGEGVAATLQ